MSVLGGLAGLRLPAGTPAMRAIYNHLYSEKQTKRDDSGALAKRKAQKGSSSSREVVFSFDNLIHFTKDSSVRYTVRPTLPDFCTFYIGEYLAAVVKFLSLDASAATPRTESSCVLYTRSKSSACEREQVLYTRLVPSRADYFGTFKVDTHSLRCGHKIRRFSTLRSEVCW